MIIEALAVSKPIDGGSPADLIAQAGRVCYRSDSKKSVSEFVRARIKDGHESILEHGSITFLVRGISRACSHQLVRHRIASYSQESQRYVDMKCFQYVVPPSIDLDERLSERFSRFMDTIEEMYSALRSNGIKKEDARFVLPNATVTNIVVTMNFRALRNFIKTRLTPEAQWEIRELALKFLFIAYDLAPAVFYDLMKDYLNKYQDSLTIHVD